jgi:hypothetical protein
MTDIHPNTQPIRDLFDEAGSTFVTVDFYKADGSERSVTFNPRDFNEINGTVKPSGNPNVFRIREVHNKETGKTVWRSFDASRVRSITAKGRTVKFNVEGQV